MPQPSWASGSSDMLERPHTPSEIIGRGPRSRDSKTFIQSIELATLLGFIDGHSKRLAEAFKRLHARKYTIEVVEEDREGNETTKTVPHVLTDAEVRHLYPVVREWEELHLDQVDHYASIGGFSVRAASGLRDEEVKGGRSESSAGTDRQRSGAGDLNAGNPRWRS